MSLFRTKDTSNHTLKWSDAQIKAWNARMKEWRIAAGIETKPVVIKAAARPEPKRVLNWWEPGYTGLSY